MKNLEIRPALVNEAAILEALQWRASLENDGDRESLLAHPDAIVLPIEQIELGQVFVAEQNGSIAGFAVAIPRADGQFELDGLFVEPSIWKSGVGRALVKRCADYALNQGATALHVVGNPHAKGFYVACDFEPIGFEKTQFGKGILMRKSL